MDLDPWDVCLKTRVLSSFLDPQDLCRLSQSCRSFLGFRDQIWHVRCSGDTEDKILSRMSAGDLPEVNTLVMQVKSIHRMGIAETGRAVKKERSSIHNPSYLSLVDSAFNNAPKLERLECSGYHVSKLSWLIEKGLTAEKKASLKALTLFWWREKNSPSYFAESAFHGFSNLEVLNLCPSCSDASVALDSFCSHDFPRLHTLVLENFSRIVFDSQVFQRLVEAILHGGMPHVKSLSLGSVRLVPAFVTALIDFMPHLDYLRVRENGYSTAGKKRLEAAAAELGVTFVFEIGRW